MSDGPIPGPWPRRRLDGGRPVDPRSFWSGWGCGCVLGVVLGVSLVALGVALGVAQ